MPAAAVIPAPIAYIKVVAVKKLVVEFRNQYIGRALVRTGIIGFSFLTNHDVINLVLWEVRTVTLKKIRVFKAGFSLNTLAWNNEIGRSNLFCWFLGST